MLGRKLLSEQVGDAPQRFHALMGLRRYYLHRGRMQTAHELGKRLIGLAHSMQDPVHLSRAHMLHQETLYCLGELEQIQRHCEEGLAAYDRQLSHPFNLVLALYFDAFLHQFRREAHAVEERVEEVLQISLEQGFALYQAWGTILRGWSLAERGKESDGINQMCKGIAALRSLGVERTLPDSLASLARAYGKVGEIEKGLILLAEALDLISETGERCWEAELYRLKGELLLKQSETNRDIDDAEVCFRRAIDVAHRQSAKSWELRAATSLSHLWQEQGKRDQAYGLLHGTYAWFQRATTRRSEEGPNAA